MDMIGTSRILDTALRGPHSSFDKFGVSMIDYDDVTLYNACTDAMDMISTGHILDASPPGPRSAFDVFGNIMLEFDGDGLVATDITHDTIFVEGASDSVDPPLSFDTMSGFVTRFDDKFDGQKLRRLHRRWSLQVKEEIQKQLSVSFLLVVEYPEWLANVVPIPKKDGKVRVCVDFRDLNKASPKDDFPLPHIDMLVDSTARHSMLSFMDGFSGYNHILMALEDMEKTSFITEWSTYYYRVMPFGLKNAGATYQRAATTLFHDMMHRDVKKCTFGVTYGKLLGHIVSERGIEVGLEKIRAILDMPAPRTETEIRGFLGRLQYIIRFIDRLTDTCEPIFRLLRKNQPIVWNDDCQRTFKKIKECLLFPLVLVPPTPGRPLLLYLSISDMALGCILAQLNDSGKVRAIYYLSKRMLEYECRYIMIERLYLALVWVTRRLRHYVTEYSILLVSRLDPLRYLFDRPILTGRLMRWFRDYARPWSQTVGDPRGFQLGYSVDSRFEKLRYIHLPRAENQFADALATLAFVIEIPAGVTVRPLLIETRSTPAYCCLIGDIEDQDELPWYHDIYQFLLCGVYPESASTKDRRALKATSH
uniref:Retrovirus-related Pol polyprotein from transposon 17.6 n=1 Tax=Vitis vinifera TaxID=29760 RepID=A5C9E8_VITVI|nr:hypothetical protein VITISV_023367 [Vitis vinifera]